MAPLQPSPPPQDALIPSRLGLQLGLGCLGYQGDQGIPEEHKKRGSDVGGQMEEGYMVGGRLRRRNLGIWKALIGQLLPVKKEASANAGKAQVGR